MLTRTKTTRKWDGPLHLDTFRKPWNSLNFTHKISLFPSKFIVFQNLNNYYISLNKFRFEFKFFKDVFANLRILMLRKISCFEFSGTDYTPPTRLYYVTVSIGPGRPRWRCWLEDPNPEIMNLLQVFAV